jgi:lysophospholipase L1-like esterase
VADLQVFFRNIKAIRIALVSFGLFVIVIALTANQLGFGIQGSFGTGQVIQMIIGLLLALTGLLGRKMKDFYLGTAVVLLNSLLLLGVMELGAITIARLGLVPSYSEVVIQRYLTLPYYREQEWTHDFWREARQAESYRYEPYLIWRHQPFEGSYVNVSKEGIRYTPGSDCRPNGFTIFMFGGSSMWGWGSPDWGTIPAYLQKGLNNALDRPVCVINMGEDAFVSTQGKVALALQLQSGTIPDAVVFYDGVNDVYVAYESGQPGAHPMLGGIASRFEDRESGLSRIIKSSRQYWLAKKMGQLTGITQTQSNQIPITGGQKNPLADEVVELYMGNYFVIEALAHYFGFDYFFFWQPHLAAGGKVFTEQEQEIRTEIDPVLSDLAQDVYTQIEEISIEYNKLWFISHIFDEYENQIWIDAWGHVTPEGNQIVAEYILDVLIDHLSGN